MGFLGMWVLAPLPDEAVADVAAVLRPPVERQRSLERTQELWQQWCAAPERVGGLRRVGHGRGRTMTLDADSEAFQELSGACPLAEYDQEIYAALDRLPAHWQRLALAAGCSKGYPAAALAHGLGPTRFAALPGWFGDMLLTARQVRTALPAVERALTLPPGERRAAEDRTVEWLCDSGDGHPREAAAMLDGVLPFWRAAAAEGAGVLGAMFIP
ncbi:hypothetical protein ACFVHB_28055 [Kitasatospora sp. NPDC127111]|uniref:hypothetical protein n=1 Tax=Kitasatospora sp. NPDC127111 TaxID=3345363 RepID=UPI003635C560